MATTMKNNHGNITLVALVAMLLLSTLAVIHVFRLEKYRKEILKRNQIYLCFEYLGKTTKDHLEAMAALNITIRTAYLGRLSPEPATRTAMSALWNSSKALQEILHLSYLGNVTVNNFCKTGQGLSYVMKYPFKKTGLVLARIFDGSVPLKYNEWNIQVITPISLSHLEKPIILEGRYKMTNAFNPSHQLSTTEKVLPSLKAFSGWPSSRSLPSL